LRYPSDLTDGEWALVEPLIPPAKRGGNRRTVNVRKVVDGLMDVLSTGCQWRALPKDLPPRSTVYDYFDLWSWDGTLDRIHDALYLAAASREASPTAAIYGYATGVLSSRRLERATYDSVAFRFIAANDHPDHDTIATFRRRFLREIEALFVQVLLLAREMGVLKMGTVALDGTKIHANASRHSALSHEHAGKIEAQLKAEVADLMAKAEAADAADIPDGMSIPDELARREERLRKLAEARAKIEARAKERYAREQAEYEARLAARRPRPRRAGKSPAARLPNLRSRGRARTTRST
jgi:transposase